MAVSGSSSTAIATVAAPLDAIPESAALAIPDTGTQPEVSAAAAMPAPQTPAVTNAARGAEATRAVVAARPEPRAEEVPIASLPSPRPPAIDDVESSRGNSGSNTVADLAIPAANPGESVSSVEEAASDVDGQVTETPALNSGEQ